MSNIVMVQYKGKPGFGGREYGYYTEAPLKKGDVVMVPTLYGNSIAQVSRIHVRESEVASVLHLMRTIPKQESINDKPAETQESLFGETGVGA